MNDQLDLGLFLDLMGMCDNAKTGIITIPASVLRRVNAKLCVPFTARDCSCSSHGREVSRVVCWKFIAETNPVSLQEAHKYWRLQCGMTENAISQEWQNLQPKLDRLQEQYYGKPDDTTS